MQDIKISALGSLYHKESPVFLKQSLESLFEQTFPLDEVVLIIDGPIGNELNQVINEFLKYPNFSIHPLNKNVGLGKALSIGLNVVKNEYVLRFDTDDINFNCRVDTSIKFLLDNNLDVCSSDILEFNENINDLNLVKKVPYSHDAILKYAKWRSPMNHMAVLFRKSIILKNGSYENVLNFEDYFLWCKLLKNGAKFGNINTPLVYARVGNNMILRRKGIDYFKKEYFFANKVYSLGFFTLFEYLRFIILRLPLRILPSKVLSLFYLKFLRSKID